MYDVIVSDEKTIENQCELAGDIARVMELVNQELTEREREIICKRYGLLGEKEITQREVASQMGISRSYVSRIEKKALSKLYEKW